MLWVYFVYATVPFWIKIWNILISETEQNKITDKFV